MSEVLQAVQGGKSLAEALAQHPYFPTLYVNMVRAGEMGGFLDQALQRLAEYLERGQQLRDDVRAALTYPALLTVAMGGSMMVLLIYVLPKFSALFADMGKALPLSARIVMGVSNVLRNYWWIGLLVIGSGVVAFRYSVRTPRGRYAWDAWKLRIVGIGTCCDEMEVASLARTFGTLLKSGVPMLQALGITKQIAGNQVIARAIGEVEVGAREGAGVAEPLARSGVFPTLAVQMISVGEETGRLDDMLIRIADHYDREVRVADRPVHAAARARAHRRHGPRRRLRRDVDAVGDLQRERSADVRRNPCNPRARQAGFTLIEMMVVMVIIGLLMASGGAAVHRHLAEGRRRRPPRPRSSCSGRRSTRSVSTSAAIRRRRRVCGALQNRPFGLDRWDGPYLKKDIPLDPWGRPYVYRAPGEGGRPYDLFSLGADGAPGGENNNRDVTSWD